MSDDLPESIEGLFPKKSKAVDHHKSKGFKTILKMAVISLGVFIIVANPISAALLGKFPGSGGAYTGFIVQALLFFVIYAASLWYF
jgi:hypothetical protein